jgi:hypothetical protein
LGFAALAAALEFWPILGWLLVTPAVAAGSRENRRNFQQPNTAQYRRNFA